MFIFLWTNYLAYKRQCLSTPRIRFSNFKNLSLENSYENLGFIISPEEFQLLS